MKKRILIFFAFYTICNVVGMAQEKDSIKQPDEKIKVNREFDDNGNLIRYDSIYSYSSGNLSIKDKQIDSIINHFFSERKEEMPFHNFFEMRDFMFPNFSSQNHFEIDSIVRQQFEKHQKHIDSLFQY